MENKEDSSHVGQFTCSVCKATFSRKPHLGNHMRKHSKKKSVEVVDDGAEEATQENNLRRSSRKRLPKCVSDEFVTAQPARKKRSCVSGHDEKPNDEIQVKKNDGKITVEEHVNVIGNKRPVGRPKKRSVNHQTSVVENGESQDDNNQLGSKAIVSVKIEFDETDERAAIDEVNQRLSNDGSENLPKRGRGRSKKVVNAPHVSIDVNTEGEVKSERSKDIDKVLKVGNEDQVNLEVIPKRRGRPRKSEIRTPAIVKTTDVDIVVLKESDHRENDASKTPKKRLRSRTQSSGVAELDVSNEIDSTDEVLIVENGNDKGECSQVKSKRRGRPKKSEDQPRVVPLDVEQDCVIVENEDQPEENGEVKPNKRGRPKKSAVSKVDDTWAPTPRGRPKLNTVKKKGRKKLTQDEESITCSCLMEFPSLLSFKQHVLRVHYGLARRVGDDRPFEDLEKKQLLLQAVRLLKKLRCQKDNCDKVFTTVGGYLYHENVCGTRKEDRMVLCQICGKSLLLVSMKTHFKALHEKKPEPVKMQLDDSDKSDDTSRRKAAKRASEKLTKMIKEDGNGDAGGASDEEYKAGSNSSESSDEDSWKNERAHQRPMSPQNEQTLLELWKTELDRSGCATCRHEGCHQLESNLEDMVRHLHKCRYRLHDVYECSSCGFRSGTKIQVSEHIKELHSLRTEDALNVESNDHLVKTLKCTNYVPRNDNCDLRKGNSNITKFMFKNMSNHLRYTQKFMQENYFNDGSNFEDWMPNVSHWNRLTASECEQFLPMIKSSPEFQVKSSYKRGSSSSEPWTKFNLFESASSDGDRIWKSCFVGGPVKACAWCPTSSLADCRQFFALYCHQNPDFKYICKDVYQKPCLIQIWDLGNLEIKDNCQPKLVMAIADNCGAVWQLRWCPSGCWDRPDSDRLNALPRLGLLAASCADGLVKIYSIPYPSSLKQDDGLPIYRVKPQAVLSLSLDPEFIPHSQSTALSWFEGKGHDYIAGGFSDGLISVWDLKTKSSLLVSESEDKTRVIMPFLCFRGHGGIVTGIDLCPLHSGKFLVSCSRDRCVKFWNLDDVSLPINVVRKRAMTAVKWLPHWGGAFAISDECYTLKFNGMVLVETSCLDYPVSIVSHGSSIMDLSPSYWFNCAVSCDDAGEVVIGLFGEMSKSRQIKSFKRLPLYRVDLEVKSRLEPEDLDDQSSVGKTIDTVKEESDDEQNDIFSLEDVIRRFRLIYSDVPLDQLKNLPVSEMGKKLSLNSMEKSVVDRYPLNSVNRVAWNPNLGSHQWIATGEQSGIIRFLPAFTIDFVPVDQVREKMIKKPA